jgi:hypothetical protein
MPMDLFMHEPFGHTVPGCARQRLTSVHFCEWNLTMNDAQDKGTTSIGLVREAILVATQRNLGVPASLQHAGIAAELLNVPRASVPALAFSRLWPTLARNPRIS